MNWKKIVKYAAALFAAQSLIGLLDGLLEPTWGPEDLRSGVAWLIGSSAVSFVACCSIFAHLARRQTYRPLGHAWLALLLESVVGFLLDLVVDRWLGSTPILFIAVSYAVVISALLVGTMLGCVMRVLANPSQLMPNNSFKPKPLRGSA